MKFAKNKKNKNIVKTFINYKYVENVKNLSYCDIELVTFWIFRFPRIYFPGPAILLPHFKLHLPYLCSSLLS